jgi:saccharopine dehydrogenase-like NADP-dependent oxidoreductase
MARSINEVRVIGLGKVGELVALLLADSGFTVTAYDARARSDLPFACKSLDVRDEAGLRAALAGSDAVVSCMPYNLNLGVAEAASELGVHYFDLTEDVPTTHRVLELAAKDPRAVFVPQCGLAPGLIGIVGSWLAKQFDQLRSIELKVGALPRHPAGLLGYAFNWSAEGVVNEYLNDCEVLRGGHRQLVPAMTENERVVIGGIELEASLTSGGLGTMCDTYENRVQRLDYKTMRYPGHFELMRFFFDELGLRERRELAGEILVEAKPPVDDDVVYLHAAVEGRRAETAGGQPYRKQYVRAYQPLAINGRHWRAISWTTAASAVAVLELVADGRLPQVGFVKQEDISFTDLLSTKSGALFGDLGKV